MHYNGLHIIEAYRVNHGYLDEVSARNYVLLNGTQRRFMQPKVRRL